jgi:ABC-2 type transport system permease protein
MIKGNNVFYLGIASLQVMFEIAPYILIFLVSAITMKSISDEKRLGTLEILTTKPITDTAIIAGKFFASVTLIAIAIVPTLFYFYAVYQLATPVGNVDIGATIGSYFGLILLAACYASIGMFSSSLTDNQIVALITSMLLNFFFFGVLSMLGEASWLNFIGKSLEWFGLEFHYDSISRGLVDTRDVIYFVGFILVFLGLTKIVFESRKW